MGYFDRSQERLEFKYGPKHWTGATTNNLFALFNSAAFVTFLEEMTGFDGLIPDASIQGRRPARDHGGRTPERPRRLQPASEARADPPAEPAHLPQRRLVAGIWRKPRTVGQGHDSARGSCDARARPGGHLHHCTRQLPRPSRPPDLSTGSVTPVDGALLLHGSDPPASPMFRCAPRSSKSDRGRATRPTGRSRAAHVASDWVPLAGAAGDCQSARVNDWFGTTPPRARGPPLADSSGCGQFARSRGPPAVAKPEGILNACRRISAVAPPSGPSKDAAR